MSLKVFKPYQQPFKKLLYLSQISFEKRRLYDQKQNVQEPYAVLNILWRPVKKPVLLRERVYLNGRLSDRGLPTCKLAKGFTICPVCVGFSIHFGFVR